jgi:predicted nucleic acid-binding protein
VAAVSNSSPLILYAKIGRLDLLRAVFTEIVIPPAVYQEVVTDGSGLPGAAEIRAGLRTGWIVSAPLSPSGERERAVALRAGLDGGEAEAIALALAAGVSPVLLDDRDARRFARQRGVRVIGSAGVLLLAKGRGLIPLVRPLLDELLAAGLYLSGFTYREVLARAGE